jgi:heme/copper-type cytochrome/quinol oxidase subunit 1
MSNITNKPYLIFWLSIPLIMLSGIISSIDDLVFNVHDTYYVFSLLELNILVSILFGIIGLGYWMIIRINKRLSVWMNLIHIVLTFGGILLIWILGQFYRKPETETLLSDFEINNNLDHAIFIAVLIVISVQVFYLINISLGIIKKKNKTSG